MIAPDNLEGKNIVVMGLGKSGISVLKALKNSGAALIAWDDDEARRAECAKEGFRVSDLAREDWKKIDSLILSPGIPHTLPAPHPVASLAKKTNVEIVCDVEFFFRARPKAKCIGVTGTNGKSTTTALIAHILKESGRNAVGGGNLGLPVLSFPELSADGFYVIEMSSYQCELTPSAAFDVVVWLNITPDHIDRHGNMEGYVAAKKKLLRAADKKQVFVVGVDDSYSVATAGEIEKQGHWQTVRISSKEKMPEVSTLPGAHNAQNMAAATAACRALELNAEEIRKGIMSYPGLPHRQKLAGSIRNLRFINDSKATNADAAGKALGCYDTIYWIAGGRPKEGGLNGLESFMPRIQHAFLIGEAAEDFARWLKSKASATLCGTLENAVYAAAEMGLRDGKPGAVVLLSPACASWDQFRNYEHRGDEFIRFANNFISQQKAA